MLNIHSLGGRSVRLMHTAVTDAGRYTCIVSNSGGEERKNFDLVILGNKTVNVTSSLFLNLSVQASLQP